MTDFPNNNPEQCLDPIDGCIESPQDDEHIINNCPAELLQMRCECNEKGLEGIWARCQRDVEMKSFGTGWLKCDESSMLRMEVDGQ